MQLLHNTTPAHSCDQSWGEQFLSYAEEPTMLWNQAGQVGKRSALYMFVP